MSEARNLLMLWCSDLDPAIGALLTKEIASTTNEPSSDWIAQMAVCSDSRPAWALCGMLTGASPLGRSAWSPKSGRILRRTLLDAARAAGRQIMVIGEGPPLLPFEAKGHAYRDLAGLDGPLFHEAENWLMLVCLGPGSQSETLGKLRRALRVLPHLTGTLTVVMGNPARAFSRDGHDGPDFQLESWAAVHGSGISAGEAQRPVSQLEIMSAIARLSGLSWTSGDEAGDLAAEIGAGAEQPRSMTPFAAIMRAGETAKPSGGEATVLYADGFRLIREDVHGARRFLLQRADRSCAWRNYVDAAKTDELNAHLLDLEGRARPARTRQAMRRSLIDLRYAL